MSLTVFFAVLLAALIHASWNAVIKGGGDKVHGMLVLTFGHAGVGLLMLPFVGFPPQAAWGWLSLSVLIHAAYQSFLALAYSHGDLSRVYPISRGTAPLMVLIYGAFFLPDAIATLEYAGVVILGAGIFLMARGVFSSGESLRLLPFAFAAATATAGYTIADGQGARAAGSASVYIAWLFILSAFAFTPVCFALKGRDALRIPLNVWKTGMIAGIASTLAYWIAVWGMTQAPIALVAALRETSILWAVLIGVVFFRERFDVLKMIAAGLIVTGVVVTRL